MQTIQTVLSRKLFSRIVQKKSLEEVEAAGFEEVKTCPFCDFSTIPAEVYIIFNCSNPECIKEFCRMCKNLSHISLRRNKVKNDKDVKARIFEVIK